MKIEWIKVDAGWYQVRPLSGPAVCAVDRIAGRTWFAYGPGCVDNQPTSTHRTMREAKAAVEKALRKARR
jgi:hypothetical protein